MSGATLPRLRDGAAPAGRAGGRPGRTAVWRLPPWTRAPWLGLRSPGAVLAVLVTTAVLACAGASAPLFLSSARSAALQQQLAPSCAEAAWPTTGGFLDTGGRATPAQVAAAADAWAGAWTALGRTSERKLLVQYSLGRSGNGQPGIPVDDPAGRPLSQPASLFWRAGALDHVHVVQRSPGSGVWLPASYARAAGARVGDRITLAGVGVRITGLYTDLFDTAYGSWWCAETPLFLNPASADVPPPALVLATDEGTAFRVAAAARWVTVQQQVPEDAAALTVTRAHRLLGQQGRAQAAAAARTRPHGAEVNTRLPQAVGQAERIERGLRGPVVPVALAGALLALVLVASAGSFWADRRAAEVRLLAARGVGPGALAGKAALEMALPALAGAAVGWAASRLLTAALGPADDLDPGATRLALVAGAAAFAVGLACAAAVAGLHARGTTERPLGAAPRRLARVPEELLLVAAAVACWALLEGRRALVVDHGVAQVDGLLVAFPLLGVAGTAVLAARLAAAGLPALRRWAARRGPAVFLAVNRLAAARAATATLLVAVTLPVAVLGYTATLTASSRTTIDAKVGVQLGAASALATTSFVTPDARTGAVGTVVQRYDGAVGGGDVQVLAVDPRTFARTAFWHGSFADEPLPRLLARLAGPAAGGRLPVMAQGLPPGPASLRLGTDRVPVQVVATARVLPGRRTTDPVLLLAAGRLPGGGRLPGADRVSELWTNGPVGPATEALLAAGGRAPLVYGAADVFTTANFLGITWTFGYLSALAVFTGVLAVGGLLLHLEARSRTRVPGYVMARRLGLGRGTHLRSLVVELGGVAATGLALGGLLAAAAVAVVYRRLDVDLVRPPTPLLDVPWAAVALTAGVTVVVAVAAAGYAQLAADRADPATVLRE
jgi:putative ABC transport system permease protein